MSQREQTGCARWVNGWLQRNPTYLLRGAGMTVGARFHPFEPEDTRRLSPWVSGGIALMPLGSVRVHTSGRSNSVRPARGWNFFRGETGFLALTVAATAAPLRAMPAEAERYASFGSIERARDSFRN